MNKILDINERIMYLIDFQYKGSQKKFAERIGFAAQVVYNIVSGRKSKPSYDVIYAILSTNDDLNPEWLVMGHGEMLKSNVRQEQANNKEVEQLRFENSLLKENNELLKFKIETLEKNVQDKSKSVNPMEDVIRK